MIKKWPRYSLVLGMLLGLSAPSFAQRKTAADEQTTVPTTRILLIYDCSNSMNARWQSDSKISISKKLLSNILDSLSGVPHLQLALRVYGHQKNVPPIDCEDTRLEVPFAPDNTKRIIQKIKTLVPRGGTPIAYSLEKAADDFPPCTSCRNIIILITDGIEECGGDACAASTYLQQRGIVLKPFIIGIGTDFSEAFSCVGKYFDASQETEFIQAFNVVISQALESTTAQVNLLDLQGQPTETALNMSFYDRVSGLLKYNYVHAQNARGLSDTLTLDPLLSYRLVVHTLPPTTVDSITVHAGRHNILAADVPQGQLKLVMNGSQTTALRSLSCLMRQAGSGEIFHVQSINYMERYKVGSYDLEVLTLPRLKIPGVKIDQSTVTTVEIPQPGIAVLQKSAEGYGSLYVEENNELKLIYNMNERDKTETLHLQPGRYRIVLRSRFIPRSSATMEQAFTIESGKTTSVKL